MSIRRTKQMGSLMREELARLLLHEVADPRLHDLVVTDVEMSSDLKLAHVYFTKGINRDSVNEKEVAKSFKRATPFLRRKIGLELKLRSVPELDFRLDTHGVELDRVLSLLETAKENSTFYKSALSADGNEMSV